MHFKLLLGVWLRLLKKYGSYIAPAKYGRAFAITVACAQYSLLDLIQSALYKDELAKVELPRSPIFIIGHWRSGTSLLHELLCLDARHSYANTYACMNPSHFLLLEKAMRASPAWSAFARRPMDAMTVSYASPQEDEFALFALGAPSPYVHWMFPASLLSEEEYFDLDAMSPADRERWKDTFTTFFKKVSLRYPGRTVVKSPPHSFRVNVLHDMFPEAVFIHIVRDPYVLFASTRNLLVKMFDIYGLTSYRMDLMEEYILRNGANMERRLDIAVPGLRRDRYHRVRYEDLVRSPTEQMTTLYEELALGDVGSVLPDIQRYFDANAAYRTNRYDLSAYDRSQITERWRDMFIKYGYETSA